MKRKWTNITAFLLAFALTVNSISFPVNVNAASKDGDAYTSISDLKAKEQQTDNAQYQENVSERTDEKNNITLEGIASDMGEPELVRNSKEGTGIQDKESPDANELEQSKKKMKKATTDIVKNNAAEENIETFSDTTQLENEEGTDVVSGECGTLVWQLDRSTGNFVIEGTGDMFDYADISETPWNAETEYIKTVTVSDGITSVGAYAFAGIAGLKEIYLPDSLVMIGRNAFDGCSGLSAVVLPDSIEKMGFQAFANCTALSDINLPLNWKECVSTSTNNNITSDNTGHIFEGCTKLTEITVPEGMTGIPAYGFCYSESLTDIYLPSTLTVINNHTFYNCTSLTSIQVPQGVKSINKSAFCYCEALETVVLPEGLTELMLYSFYGCKALNQMTLPDSIEKMGYQCFADCTELNNINIPLNWKECPTSSTSGNVSADYCGHIFEGCTNLTEITVPEGMTEIPSYGFCGSDYLTVIYLPESLTIINNHTFYNCKRLINVQIPDGITSIGKSAFCYCTALENVILPESIIELALYSFYECKSLKTIRLPNSIEKIGYQAFADCTELTEINIPIGWKECPSSSTAGTLSTDYCGHIFEGCKKLTEITVPEGITEIPSFGFCKSDYLTKIHLPKSLTTIRNHTFYGCSKLDNVQIPERITVLGKSSFLGCQSLTDIYLPDSLIQLCDYAFEDCQALVEMQLPDSVEKIGYRCFADCTKLEQINIPLSWKECSSNTENTGVGYQGSIFNGCTNLVSVTVPEGITEIPEYGFSNCDELCKIQLPITLNKINAYAFYSCDYLIYLDIPNNVTKIENHAFMYCDSMQFAKIPSKIECLEPYVFSNCSKLSSITIYSSLKLISDNAFRNVSLKNIYYEGTDEQFQNISKGNNEFNETKINFGILCDYEEPEYIVDSSYSKPSDEAPESFYGGMITDNSGSYREIDIEEVFLGKMNKKMFVSLPKDTYVTLGFKKALLCPDNTSINLITTGEENERADIYVETLSGELIFVSTIYETTNFHNIELNNIDDYIVGVKIVGRDLGGASPGFDMVSLALVAQETDKNALSKTNTMVTLKRKNKSYDLLKERQIINENSEEEVSILISPDWGNENPGMIALVQNNDIILQNKGGAFVDIIPSQKFHLDDNIFVVMLNSDNKIVEQLKLGLVIKSEEEFGSSINQTTVWYDIWCVNDKYKSYTRNFDLHVGDKVYNTGDKYRAEADISREKAGEVSVTKTGYRDCKIPEELVYSCNEVILHPEDTSGAFVQFLTVKRKSDRKYTNISSSHFSIFENTMQSYDMYVDIDWNGHPAGKIYLKQGEKALELKEGLNTDLILGGTFAQSGGEVDLYWESADGYSWKQGTYINVYKTPASNISIDGGESLSGTNEKSNKEDEVWGEMTFSFDMFKDAVPVELTLKPTEARKGTFEGTLGISINNEEAQTSVFDYVKDRIKGMPEGYVGKDTINNIRKNLVAGGNKVSGEANYYGISVDTNFFGYVEGEYTIGEDGKLGKMTFTDSGVTAALEGAISTTRQHFVTPIPWYWQLELKAALGLKMGFGSDYEDSGAAIAPLKTETSLSIGAKAAAGISGAASVGVKGTGTVHVDGQVLPFTLSKLNAYADYKIDLGQFEIGPWLSGSIATIQSDEYYLLKEGRWFWEKEQKAARALMDNASGDTDELKWEQTGRNYLNKESEFTANRTVSVVNRAATTADETLHKQDFKTNTYTFTEPKVAALEDGKKIMVWVDDPGETVRPAEINRSALYYSLYDGTSWGEPQIVADDGTADMSPVLKVYDGETYLTWVNANKVLNEGSTYEEYCGALDIAYAKLNNTTGKFEDVSSIQINEYADFLADIILIGKTPTVVWVQNSDNDLMQFSGTSYLYSASLTDGVWTVELLKDNLQAVDGLCAVDENGSLAVYLSQDTDSDIFTVEDKEIFKVAGNVVEQMTENSVIDSKPQSVNGNVYWYSDGRVTDGEKVIELEESTDRVCFVTDGTQEAILYTRWNEDCSTDIYANYKEAQGWSKPVHVVTAAGYVQKFSGVFAEDNSLEVAVNEIQMTEDNTYQQADMRIYKQNTNCNLTINSVEYYCQNYTPGEELRVTAYVTNSGTERISRAKISLYQEEKELQTELVHVKLSAGDETELILRYTIPENISEITSFDIKVSPLGQSDVDEGDNSSAIMLRRKDVSVENVAAFMEEETTTVSAYISNRGLDELENIAISLRKGSDDGEILATKDIDKLAVSKGQTVSFDVSLPEDTIVYVVAEKLDEENITANNSDFTLLNQSSQITSSELSTIDLSKISVGVEKSEYTYTGKEIKPQIILSDITGLIPGNDYSVAYRNNVDVGVATVTVKGISDKVVGEQVGYFEIVKADPEIDVPAMFDKTLGDEPFVLGAIVPGNGRLTYQSSDTNVVEVSPSGIVMIKGTGKATITVTAEESQNYNGAVKKVEITVTKASMSVEEDNSGSNQPSMEENQGETNSNLGEQSSMNNVSSGNTKISRLKITGISKKIAAGRRVKLTAEVSPANAASKVVIWRSLNPKIATVDANGVVSVRKKTGGQKVLIMATAADGSGVRAVYQIKSMKGVVKKVVISGAKTVKAGKKLKLKAKVTATKKANKKILWISSNSRLAKVSSTGVVKTTKAAKGKKVKITAMATDGSNKKAVYKIKIK